MKLDIIYKNNDEYIQIHGTGWLFFNIINFSNQPKQMLKEVIKDKNSKVKTYYRHKDYFEK